MEFSDDIGKLQRLMAASSAGIARRQAIMDNLVIKADDKIIDIVCGGGYLLELLANQLELKEGFMDLIQAKNRFLRPD